MYSWIITGFINREVEDMRVVCKVRELTLLLRIELCGGAVTVSS